MEATLDFGKDKVRNVTPDEINKKIENDIREHIAFYSSQNTTSIRKRIKELDNEWDIERTLELNASVIAFSGVVLAGTVSKKWLIIPGIVTAFLAQHAIQGWCPPISLFRKLGVRTQKEIQVERHALLKMLDENLWA